MTNIFLIIEDYESRPEFYTDDLEAANKFVELNLGYEVVPLVTIRKLPKPWQLEVEKLENQRRHLEEQIRRAKLDIDKLNDKLGSDTEVLKQIKEGHEL